MRERWRETAAQCSSGWENIAGVALSATLLAVLLTASMKFLRDKPPALDDEPHTARGVSNLKELAALSGRNAWRCSGIMFQGCLSLPRSFWFFSGSRSPRTDKPTWAR